MFKWITLFLLSLSCAACSSESVAPHMKYSAVFDNSKIDAVEIVLDDIAKRNNLEVFKKDRESMSILSLDKEAFFTTLYFHDAPILVLTNVGVAEKLVLTATDYREMTLSELERITAEIIQLTEGVIGTQYVSETNETPSVPR